MNPAARLLALGTLIVLIHATTAHAQVRPDLVWMRGGHTGAVRSVAYSPDGKYFASGSDDGTTKLWRLSDGMLLRTLPGGIVVALTPDDKTLASSPGTGQINLWSVPDGASKGTLTSLVGNIRCLSASLDSKLLAGGTTAGSVAVWNLATGQSVWSSVAHNIPVDSIAFSPDGTMLASGAGETQSAADDTIKVWRASDGLPLQNTSVPAITPYGPGVEYKLVIGLDNSTVLLAAGGIATYRSGKHCHYCRPDHWHVHH